MSPNEIIKLIHDRKDLCKIWRKLSMDERREVLRREGELKERLEEVRTRQPRLFTNADFVDELQAMEIVF